MAVVYSFPRCTAMRRGASPLPFQANPRESEKPPLVSLAAFP
jgi:hypothetical protein